MFDRQSIYERFASCHTAENPTDLAKILGLHFTTTYQWRSGKYQVPWSRLKQVVDEKKVTWDWLIEGVEPKKRPRTRHIIVIPLTRSEINSRFLSVFSGMTQVELGTLLGVSQVAVHKWESNKEQVPWKKLKYAVDNKSVTWEWLLEGRG